MCFSAEASFVGSIVITTIGVATITKIHKSSQLVFASIPLFFGLQQFVEGCLWITLPLEDYLWAQKIFTYWFLVMAQLLWPIMIPLSVMLMEENEKLKRWLTSLLVMGITLAGYYGYCLLVFEVSPQISNYHIQYDNTFPDSFAISAFIIYVIVTITPLFISSLKRTYLLGVSLLLSCIVTTIFYTQYLTSVWCFFAALMSIVIFWILRDIKIQFNLEKLKALKIPTINIHSLF